MLAFMAFSTVWGFGNVTNGFVWFNGIQVIFSWIFMFALYFVPYALMVGELGSAFKHHGGGVSSWIRETMGTKVAYYAGWTYWACHITYIASKPSGGLKALSWVIFRDASLYDSLPSIYSKQRPEPVKEDGNPRRNQYVCDVSSLHPDDVRRTDFESESGLRQPGFQFEESDSDLQSEILHIAVYPCLCGGRL